MRAARAPAFTRTRPATLVAKAIQRFFPERPGRGGNRVPVSSPASTRLPGSSSTRSGVPSSAVAVCSSALGTKYTAHATARATKMSALGSTLRSVGAITSP